MAMNLGDARLSHVNAGRPQLNRVESKQSIAASDDYYSISDNSSDDRDTVVRYTTPPLRNGSPQVPRRDQLPTHQEVIEPVSPLSTRQTSRRTSGQQERVWQDPRADASAPTPGFDDSPYIHFAIQQLTRDEEVVNRGRESVVPTQATRPVVAGPSRARDSQIIPRKALPTAVASTMSPQQPRITSSKYSTSSPENIPSPSSSAVPARTVHQNRHSLEKPAPIYEDPVTSSRPHTPQLFPPLVSREERSRAVLVPAQPSSTDYRYPTLNFVPGPLRLLSILGLIIICITLIVLLVVSTVLGARNSGLLGYNGVGTGRYFVFEYLPQLLAAIVVVWLVVIQTAMQRILPMTILARSNGYPDEDVFDKIPLYLTNFLWPNTSLLRQSFALKFCAIVFWLTLFSIPLASSLYQTRWYADASNGAFIWTTVQPVSIILIGIYIALIIALIITWLHFNKHTTGLKWDPITLADIIVLLRRTSNLTSSRTSKNTKRSSRPHSLGYWESTSRPGSVFYGIGAAHEAPLASNEKEGFEDIESQAPLQQSTFESWQTRRGSRNSVKPIYLRESFLIFYAVTAIALLIAFLVVTYLNGKLLAGFIPLLPTATAQTSSFQSFSPSNFLYSFIPSFLGLLLPLFWQPIDTAFRYLKPWTTLNKQYPSSASEAYGHTAESTLLMSYPSDLPLAVSIRALSHGHIRIAWFSFLSFISWAIPILAGGIFTAQYVPTATSDPSVIDQARGGNILIRPDPSALYAITVFLVLYALTWLFLFPGAKRRVIIGADGRSVDVRYLAGIRSVVDKSVLRENIWAEPRTRIDLVTRLIASERPSSGRWAMIGGRVVRT